MTGDAAVEAALDRVAGLLSQQIGLRPQSNLRGRLRRALVADAAASGRGVLEYVAELPRSRSAFQSLINEITVQESSFFRHPEHFRVLARDILPTLPRPVRIWCAGCGNGQEAFSLAMLLEEEQVEGTVFATDLSTDALSRAADATYSARELVRIGPERLERHFDRTEHGWRVRSHLRARVGTLRHNLVDALPQPATACQVVFCRNVLIYFAPDSTRAFLDRVADAMPAAVVFLGAAETMWSSSDRFRTVQAGDTYYYRSPGTRAPQVGAPTGARRASPAATTLCTAVDDDKAATASAIDPVVRGDRSRISAPPARPEPLAFPKVEPAVEDVDEAATAARTGQLALQAGDHRSAVVAFRKSAYLAPDDALAHVHLGFALEASGDRSSARRAFATARRTMLQPGSPPPVDALGGYATDELIRLLDIKQKELAP